VQGPPPEWPRAARNDEPPLDEAALPQTTDSNKPAIVQRARASLAPDGSGGFRRHRALDTLGAPIVQKLNRLDPGLRTGTGRVTDSSGFAAGSMSQLP